MYHPTAFVTLVMEHWLEREIAQWVHHEGMKLFYLTSHSTYFILWLYGIGHMIKDHKIVREETHCHLIGYSFRLAARVLSYASSHRQDNKYHNLYYTSRGALAGTRNSSMGSPHEGSIQRPMSEHSYHGATSRSPESNNVPSLTHTIVYI